MDIHCRKRFRKLIWTAIKKDDADRMMEILNKFSQKGNIDLETFVSRSSEFLWNEGKPEKDRGIITVLAGNVNGIPLEGCIQCLIRLMKEFPIDSPVFEKGEVERAYDMASKMQRNQILQILALLNGKKY